uniref:Germ cell-less, spermatogenesis associated n=1 Tax=Oncorhynchus mykiss TaxID=8022 RepID=A0A8C7WIH7_ONCMY
MGTQGSRLHTSSQDPEEPVETTCASGKHGCECRKRKRTAHCDCDSEPDEEDALLDTPRRKKLKSTSKYIYQTLFLNGENSDIRICALGQEWNLHKVYLCQSGYFSSMFSGSWKESNMMVIPLEIPDQNIDTEALQVVFGSLYRDDVLIKPSRVVSILAVACMLQLDGLIQHIYGLDSVMKKCLEWLLNNLMTHQNVDLMLDVIELLIQSSDLFVMQVEMDVYTALKKWMFLQFNPSWDGPIKQLLADADAWLCKRRTEMGEEEPFLKAEDGAPFTPVFRQVRLQYIINDLASARILERDNILPPDWLTSVYKSQWFAMLRTEHDNDNGPQDANKEEFESSSMRCGRKLTKDGDYCWLFKRNTLSQPCGGAVSMQPRRHLAYRLRLASFDNSGKLVCSRSTGYQLLTLEKDQEYVVMNLDSRLLSFPLYVCCNFQYTSPHMDRCPDSPEPESSARSVS